MIKHFDKYFSVRNSLLAIFIFAFFVRLFVVFVYRNFMHDDGIIYHNIAVNLVKGNGYSSAITAPYNPTFFREPVYPMFLATIYKVWDAAGGKVDYFIRDWQIQKQSNYLLHYYPEIFIAKVIQAILGAISCCLLFLSFRLVLKTSLAAVIGILFCFYFPLSLYCGFLLRETLQTLLVVTLSYFFGKFLLSKKYYWLVLFSFIWSLSNLTLQTTKMMPIFIFIFLLLHFKKPFLAIYQTALSTLIMLCIISPWLIRTYQYYSDVRVFKSLGTSLTHEASNYARAIKALETHGFLPSKASVPLFNEKIYNLPEKEIFEKSFNGYFSTKADSINKLIDDKSGKKRTWYRLGVNLWQSWITTFWTNARYTPPVLKSSNYVGLVFEFFVFILGWLGLIFGLFAIGGILCFFMKTYVIQLSFTYFLVFFYFIAGESRRMLPIHGYIFMFSCLFFYFLYSKYVNKKSSEEIKLLMFI